MIFNLIKLFATLIRSLALNLLNALHYHIELCYLIIQKSHFYKYLFISMPFSTLKTDTKLLPNFTKRENLAINS